MRVLLTSWAGFRRGEATAGDVLAVRAVADALHADGVPYDTAWSPGYRPGGLPLDGADPADYTHVVFVCGPVHGRQIAWLHERFAACRRIAVGVTIADPWDAALTGFDAVIPRDDAATGSIDLAFRARTGRVPVVAFIRAPGQPEYGDRRRHEQVHDALAARLHERSCAILPLDTRVGADAGAMFRGPDAFCSALARVDLVVTTRLHGLVLGLRAAVPVIAVDPVAPSAKVSAQARALGWPALIPSHRVLGAAPAGGGPDDFDSWWRWCLSPDGRTAAHDQAVRTDPPTTALRDALRDELAS